MEESVKESNQRVSGLGWYLSNLILQFVLVELNAVLEEGGKKGRKGRKMNICDSLQKAKSKHI